MWKDYNLAHGVGKRGFEGSIPLSYMLKKEFKKLNISKSITYFEQVESFPSCAEKAEYFWYGFCSWKYAEVIESQTIWWNKKKKNSINDKKTFIVVYFTSYYMIRNSQSTQVLYSAASFPCKKTNKI